MPRSAGGFPRWGRFGPAALGLAAGVAIVLTPSEFRQAPVWVVWAALAVALTTTAGAVFGYGLARWAELTALRPMRVRDVAAPISGLAAVALLLALTSIVVIAAAGQARADWSAMRGWSLTCIAAVGGIPAITAMYGIRHAAGRQPADGDRSTGAGHGRHVAELMELRRMLQRLLGAIGSLVALSTLALGAATAVRMSLPAVPGPERAPQTVLIFGGAGSVLVALVYGPAIAALQDRGRRLCAELFPVHEVTEASAILSRVEDHNRMAQILGVDRSIATDLQTGLVVLGPLLASAASTFLPP